jgi:tol-pal system protein YbgF
MKKTIFLISSIIAIFALNGCASRSEIKKFQQQLDYLTKKSNEQDAKFSRIDSLLVEQQFLMRQNNATQQSAIDQLVGEMKIMQTVAKESGFQAKNLSDKVSNYQRDQVVTPTPTKVETVAVSTNKTTKKPDAKKDIEPVAVEPQATVNIKQLFETAQLDLNKGKYELAKTEFEQVTTLFPNSTLADDAQYYVGECFYALGRYDAAKKSYQSVFDKFPQSSMVPKALYKSGICSQKLDDFKSACDLFTQIVSQYPESDEAPLAEEKQQTVCK